MIFAGGGQAMQLYFAVPDTATTHDGVLVRSFLRQCAVSTDLARAVKFRGGGFFVSLISW